MHRTSVATEKLDLMFSKYVVLGVQLSLEHNNFDTHIHTQG